MSAFVVNDNHINVIVSYFVADAMDDRLWYEMNGKYGYMGKEDAEKVAQCLYSQNVRSVNDRYNELEEDGFNYTYIPHARRVYSWGEIAMALDCLEYQSCESDDYHTTDAYKIVTSMRKHLLKDVAKEQGADTWGITEVKALDSWEYRI